MRLRSAIVGAAAVAAAVMALPFQTAAQPARYPLALTPFTFTDTSGEVRDQTADHDRRLANFVARLKQELGGSGRFELADAPCADDQCRPDDTLAKARAEGKRYVVFGTVQKSSTLVLWARVDVVDSATARPVIARWITFRGDNDEAWNRTARFIARQINAGFTG